MLTIKSAVVVSDGAGLRANTEARLVGPANDILWKKTVLYLSKNLNRPCEIEQLEADNAKLLHDEIAFAAETTVNELIAHFQNDAEAKEEVDAQQGGSVSHTPVAGGCPGYRPPSKKSGLDSRTVVTDTE